MDTSLYLEHVRGYGLTTAHILYRMPDYPSILQTYVWQDYDICPNFPRLFGFLGFWQRHLYGPLQHIEVAHAALVRPSEFVAVNGVFQLM